MAKDSAPRGKNVNRNNKKKNREFNSYFCLGREIVDFQMELNERKHFVYGQNVLRCSVKDIIHWNGKVDIFYEKDTFLIFSSSLNDATVI